MAEQLEWTGSESGWRFHSKREGNERVLAFLFWEKSCPLGLV